MADSNAFIQILRTPPSAPARTTRGPAAVEWPAVAEQLRQKGAAGRPAAEERCELCSADIDDEHGHLVNVPSRALLCVCRPCYLLFTHDGAGDTRFRAVPQRYEVVREFAIAGGGWESLDVPIGLAFFFHNSATGRTTAFYPSPAGATESELPLEAWNAVVEAAPSLSTLTADVEALLVRRRGSPSRQEGLPVSEEADALIVPVDACYELVGRIRRAWRGLQGGDDVWREIDAFFASPPTAARASWICWSAIHCRVFADWDRCPVLRRSRIAISSPNTWSGATPRLARCSSARPAGSRALATRWRSAFSGAAG